MRRSAGAIEASAQFFFQLALQPHWANYANAGNPVADDGQYLIGVADLGGYYEATVFHFLLNNLIGD